MSDEHEKSVTCEGCGNFASACKCDEASSFAAPAGSAAPAWPKEGDRVLHEASGKEGDVLSNVNGTVRVDWGLYTTTVQASELEYVQYDPHQDLHRPRD